MVQASNDPDPEVKKGIEEIRKNRKRDMIISIISSGTFGAILGYLLGKFG